MQRVPSPELNERSPNDAPQMEVPAFVVAQPHGSMSMPPPMTDSPFGTPRSSRPSDRMATPRRSQALGGSAGHDLHGVRPNGARGPLGAYRGNHRNSRSNSPRITGGRAHSKDASAHGGAGFHDKLKALSAMHDLEVSDLREEVVGLQDMVVQYQSLLDKVQEDYRRVRGELLCAASDGPGMSDLMQEIAGEMCTASLWEERSDNTSSTSCRVSQVDWASKPQVDVSKVNSRNAVVEGSNLELQIAAQVTSQVASMMKGVEQRKVVDKLNQRRKKKIKGGANSYMGRTFLQKVVEHGLFDTLCAIMIINNSIIIGYEVQWLTVDDTEPKTTKILGLLCTLFFFCELVLRVTADGPRFFFVFSDNRNWNWFDFVLVVMSMFDVISLATQGGASTVGMGLKTIKMLRIVRVVRVFRFFSKLSQLALMIIDSIKSLVWALIMLGIVIYVFAIFFTNLSSDYVKLKDSDGDALVVAEHFGSLWSTIYTLFHSMLNGISWYRIPLALYSIPDWTGPILAVGFVGYLSFTMLAVLNIITGVFVDNAVETARTQREFLVQKEMEVKEQWLKEMRAIFLEMDADGSGTVNKDEIAEFCNDDRVHYYLTALGLDVHDTERLFELLDENRDGELDVDEFLAGCLRLKGMARSIDVYSLIHQSRQVCRRLDDMDRALNEHMGIRTAAAPWLMPPLLSHRNDKSVLSIRQDPRPSSTALPEKTAPLPDVSLGGN